MAVKYEAKTFVFLLLQGLGFGLTDQVKSFLVTEGGEGVIWINIENIIINRLI